MYKRQPLLYKENGFKKQESAENLIQELSGKTAVVESIEMCIRDSFHGDMRE